ncbi:MAG: AAA family ATPase, partial [Micromonosporaceae bacterium]
MRTAAAAVDRAAAAAIEEFTAGTHRGVVVDSPPGAGKSTLVVRAATELAAGGEPVMVVAQTNEQVDDLVQRMATAAPTVPIGRLSAGTYVPSARVQHPSVTVAKQISDLRDVQITVATAAKWLHVADERWPWAIVDEAYQMRSDMLLRIAALFERALFVGDPGQLDPFSTIDIDRWAGLTWDPMQSAVAAMLRNNPDLPVHQLPYSWRLPPSAVTPVAGAFYPFTGFQSITGPEQRAMAFGARGFAGPVDRAVEMAARTGWALYEMPARYALRTDAEAASAVAALAIRTVQRGAVARCERTPDGAPLSPDRIAIGAAHRDQVAAIRSA